MDLSLIIPVYNSGGFLNRLFDNLAAQPIFAESRGEVIFVNDGSTDDSEQQILRFAESHPCVRYIACEHRGIQFTRNEGIRAAEGDYIAFMDSDDLMAIGSLDYMVAVAQQHNAEVVRATYKLVYEQDLHDREKLEDLQKAETPQISRISSGIEFIEATNGLQYAWNCWNVIFSKQFIIDNNLFFDEKIWYCEDLAYVWKAYPFAKKLVGLKNKYYLYIQRSGSISNPNEFKSSIKYLSSSFPFAFHLNDILKDYYKRNIISDRLKNVLIFYRNHRLYSFLGGMIKYRGLTREQINPLIKRIKEAGIYPYPHAFPEMPPGYPTSLPYRLMWRLMSYEWILRIMLRLRCSKEKIIDV